MRCESGLHDIIYLKHIKSLHTHKPNPFTEQTCQTIFDSGQKNKTFNLPLTSISRSDICKIVCIIVFIYSSYLNRSARRDSGFTHLFLYKASVHAAVHFIRFNGLKVFSGSPERERYQRKK